MTRPTAAAGGSDVVRGRAFELVDEQGQVRSSLKVESDGEVVFRLFDRKGTIRVKIGANEGGSGLLLADETTEPGIHMVARRAGTPERPNTMRTALTGVEGKQRVLEP
jgi:hypothetical protein